MEEEKTVVIKEKPKSTAGIKFFLFLAFVGLAASGYFNYYLYKQLQEIHYEMNYCKAQVEEITDYTDEFHRNLYARISSTYTDGSHILSISDIYYKKHFESNKK